MSEIHLLTTPNSATLWWELPAQPPALYEVWLDGRPCCTVRCTHVTLEDLVPGADYQVQVKSVGEVRFSTPQPKRRLDVTAAPYFAVGDGKTMNRAALQRALDDCRPDQVIYFPAGIYLTGGLTGHGDTEIYLEEGAVLQGSGCPEDYLPRVMVCQVGYNDDGEPGPRPPVFRDFLFEELTLTGRYQDVDGDGSIKPCAPVELSGFDVPGYELQNVTLRQLKLPGDEPQNIRLQHCRAVSLEQIECT